MLQQPTNEFQILLKALSYLKTHFWVFLLEILVIFGFSLYRFHRSPPVYESWSTLLIDTSRRQLYQSVMFAGISNTQNNARKQNMAYLLTSQEVMERFRNQLTDYYNTEGRPFHMRGFFPNGAAYPADAYRNWIVLTWDKNSDIYSIRCTAQNPDAAHDLCLVYMNTVQNYYPEIGQREAMMKREFLARQISSFTRQLAEREHNLAEFQKENEELISFLAMNSEGKGLQKLRLDLLETKMALSRNRATKKLIESTPRRNITADKFQITTQALSTRVSELQYRYYLTEQMVIPDRAQRLRTLQQELDLVSNQLAKVIAEEEKEFSRTPISANEIRGRLTELELEYRTSILRREGLEKEIFDLGLKDKQFQQKRLEYERLQAEISHKKKLLANLFQREQETEIELSAGNSEIFRLQEPSRSGHRVEPQLSKHLFGALSLSIFVLIVSAILLMALFPRLDSEAEVHRLSLPILGKIPVLKGQFGNMEELSPFAMEYLKIMNYRLLRETKDLKCPIVVVSSPQTGEGKSTVTYFLTLAAQSPKRKSLFVDGDLITSHPNVFFGIKEDHTPGLRSIIEENSTPNLANLTVKTMHEGIWYLPRGGRVDAIASPNFLRPAEKFLASVRDEFDMIFVDTPPLFPSNLTHQWAGIADLIVLVARMYLTRPKEIVEALQTCKIFSKAPVGIALNCMPLSAQQRRASNYYFSRRRPTKIAA